MAEHEGHGLAFIVLQKARGGLEGDGGKDTPSEEEGEQEGTEEHEALARELVDAVHAKDAAGVVDALRELFHCFEEEPHEEGPHTEEGSEEDGSDGKGGKGKDGYYV